MTDDEKAAIIKELAKLYDDLGEMQKRIFQLVFSLID